MKYLEYIVKSQCHLASPCFVGSVSAASDLKLAETSYPYDTAIPAS